MPAIDRPQRNRKLVIENLSPDHSDEEDESDQTPRVAPPSADSALRQVVEKFPRPLLEKLALEAAQRGGLLTFERLQYELGSAVAKGLLKFPVEVRKWISRQSGPSLTPKHSQILISIFEYLTVRDRVLCPRVGSDGRFAPREKFLIFSVSDLPSLPSSRRTERGSLALARLHANYQSHARRSGPDGLDQKEHHSVPARLDPQEIRQISHYRYPTDQQEHSLEGVQESRARRAELGESDLCHPNFSEIA